MVADLSVQAIAADNIVVEGYAGTDGSAVNVTVTGSLVNGNAGADSIRVGIDNKYRFRRSKHCRYHGRGGKGADSLVLGSSFDIKNSTVLR